MNLDLEGSTSAEWISALPPVHARTIQQMLDGGASLNEIALNWLAKSGPDNTFQFGAATAGQGYFDRVLQEVRKLICGDPSYDDLRKEIAGKISKHKATAIAVISAAIGAIVGLSAAVLVPVIGIILAIVSRIGVNAWCNEQAKAD